MLVSLLLLTIDRYDMMQMCIDQALRFTGLDPAEVELLVCDNGSQDKRTIEYIAKLNPAYHRLNEKNEGIAAMYNQLMLRAKGEYMCVIDNDILLPNFWLNRLVEYARLIPDTGISGLHCVEGLWPMVITEPNKIQVHYGSVFGTKFLTRKLVERVGYFNEEYFPYGFEDADYGERARQAGLYTYYIPQMGSQHVGWDTGNGTPYRKMKDDAMVVNCPKLGVNLDKYRQKQDLYKSATLS